MVVWTTLLACLLHFLNEVFAMCHYSTEVFSGMIEHCDSIEELKKEILPQLQSQRNFWKEKINQILSDTGYSCKQFAQLCRVSEPAVRKWRNGSLPQSRDMYLRIGFAAGYHLEEMNAFLKRFGRCPQLYVKSLEDSVCMFVLQSRELDHSYATYLRLLEIVRQELVEADAAVAATYATQAIAEQFSSLNDLEEMVQFAKKHVPVYRQSYLRLYKYIIAFLAINLRSENPDDTGRKASFHQLASEGRWPSSLRHCVSEVRNKKWFPQRNKIISLGLHLNMDDSAINEMLRLAQMEPLYSKNPIEASIQWAINEAKLVSDGGDVEGAEILEDLSQFVKHILIQLDLADSEYLIDDL